LITDDTLSWKNHVDYVTPKLNSTCFVVRTVKSLLSKDVLKMLYFSYIHSVMTCRVIFWVAHHTALKYLKFKTR